MAIYLIGLTICLIIDFIKTERTCCGFFTYTLTLGDNNTPLWMEITSPDGAKEFISNELEF